MKHHVFSAIVFLVSLLPMGCLHSEHVHEDHNETGQNMDTVPHSAAAGMVTQQALLIRGEAIYKSICSHCHQADGLGVAGSLPPLANSDFLMADRLRPVAIVLQGLNGSIVVNGVSYNGTMPSIKGSDTSMAAVLTYVRNHFNGATDSVSILEVGLERARLGLK